MYKAGQINQTPVQRETSFPLGVAERSRPPPRELSRKTSPSCSRRPLPMRYTNHPAYHLQDMLTIEDSNIITVLIASYRDRMCPQSIMSALAHASNPDLIRFLVIQQNIDDDKDCADFSDVCDAETGSNPEHRVCARAGHVRVRRLHARDAKGPMYARAIHDALIGPLETWALQIDAHTHFVPNWDTKLITMFRKLGKECAVLSMYPKASESDMHPTTNEPKNNNLAVIFPPRFEGERKLPRQNRAAQISHPLKDTTMPVLHATVGGGMLFSKAHRVRRVPNDPHMPFIFEGEEALLAAKMWTFGYDFYAPSEDIVFHVYSPQYPLPKYWTAKPRGAEKAEKRSEARIQHLLKMPNDTGLTADLIDIAKFGLGSIRSLEAFYAQLGIDPKTFKGKNLDDEIMNGDFHRKYH